MPVSDEDLRELQKEFDAAIKNSGAPEDIPPRRSAIG